MVTREESLVPIRFMLSVHQSLEDATYSYSHIVTTVAASREYATYAVVLHSLTNCRQQSPDHGHWDHDLRENQIEPESHYFMQSVEHPIRHMI